MPSIFFIVSYRREYRFWHCPEWRSQFSCSKSGYCGTCTKPGKDRWFRNIICDRNRAARSDLLVTYATRDRQVRDICEGGCGLEQKLKIKVRLNV